MKRFRNYSDHERDPEYEDEEEEDDDKDYSNDDTEVIITGPQSEYLKLQENIIRNREAKATTRWIRPPSLIGNLPSDINSYLYKPIFVWDPEVLDPVSKKCIKLCCFENGCGGALNRHGWGNSFRIIYDLEQNYFLYSSRFMCNTCKKTVMATEQR